MDSIDGEEESPRQSRPGGMKAMARPMGVEGLGVAALSGSGKMSAAELQVESDLRAPNAVLWHAPNFRVVQASEREGKTT